MGQTECRPCSAVDESPDVVKIEPTLLTQADAKPAATDDFSPGAAEAERRRAEEEALAEEARNRQAAEEARQQVEKAMRAEADRSAAQAAEQAKRDEVAKAQKREAEKKVATFLRVRGFKTITSPKKSCMKTSFPLHAAVEENSADMVLALLECGADLMQKNSAGKTPRALAEKLNKHGSHDAVIAALPA